LLKKVLLDLGVILVVFNAFDLLHLLASLIALNVIQAKMIKKRINKEVEPIDQIMN